MRTDDEWPSDPDDLEGGDPGEPEGFAAECQVCGLFLPLNDLQCCSDCAGKIERDLIRARDWAYSVSAFGLDQAQRETLRKHIIREYGERNELIREKRFKSKSNPDGRRSPGASREKPAGPENGDRIDPRR